MIKTQFDKNIKVLRSDNGKEYLDSKFQEYLVDIGIVGQTTCVNTPKQNVMAERKNPHTKEVARSLMFIKKVPNFLWIYYANCSLSHQ